MIKARRSLLFLASLMLSIGLFGQDDNSKDVSYSFAYIPPSLFTSNGDIGLFPIYSNFEASIHYKPFEVISFSSGFGFFRHSETLPSYYIETMIEHGRSYMAAMSGYRVPLQANYHIVKSPEKTDCYIKAVYTNALWTNKIIKYETDGSENTTRSASYIPSIGLGVGAIFLKHKKVGILLEGMFEKYLRFGEFTNSTLFSIKIGVVI